MKTIDDARLEPAWRWLVAAGLGALLVVGCDEGGGTDPECEPGEFELCTCPDGSESDRECIGGAFDECLCDGDPGGDGGVTPDGGVGPSRRFDVFVDGFSFPNYGNQSNPTNLTVEELVRLFGDQACQSGTSGSSCRPLTTMQQWMEKANADANGGHCEGMAVLSQRFFLGVQDPNQFGANTTYALGLSGNTSLQREIAYWWVTQDFARTPRRTPSEVVDALRSSITRNGSMEGYVIGIRKRDRTGGHAVTPVDLRDGASPNQVEIVIYDNVEPGMEKIIHVDTSANTWTYTFGPGDVYEGDATTATLNVTPLSERQAPFPCPQCANYAAGTSGQRQVEATGDGRVLVENEAGQQVGHQSDDSFVEDIDGAEVIDSFGATFDDREEPRYVLPGGTELGIYLSDGDPDLTEDIILSVTGPGYYLGVENVQMDPGQEDYLWVGRDIAAVSYETTAMETPDIVLAAQTDTADWVVVLRSRGDSGGQVIDAELDFSTAGGTLVFGFDGADAESEFDLYIARVDGDTEIEFYHSNVAVPNGALLRLAFAAFDADGTRLPLIMETAMGTTMIVLSDDPGTI